MDGISLKKKKIESVPKLTTIELEIKQKQHVTTVVFHDNDAHASVSATAHAFKTQPRNTTHHVETIPPKL